MAGLIGSGVSLQGLVPQDFLATWNISGTIDKSTDLGKAVSLDTTAANTAKLCASGEVIVGILASYENRVTEGIKVGAVAHKGFFKVPYVNGASALVPVIGHSVKGSATAGSVMPVASYDGPNVVVDVNTTDGYVMLMLK